MRNSRKPRRGESVPPQKKREPMIVEVVFPDPVDEKSLDAPANLTTPARSDVQNGRQREPARVVFRF